MAASGPEDKHWLAVNGTENANKVVFRDLAYWLPNTKDHLRDGIPYVRTFKALMKLPIAQIGYILAVVIKIIRKKRKIGGERLANVSLEAKVDACADCLGAYL